MSNRYWDEILCVRVCVCVCVCGWVCVRACVCRLCSRIADCLPQCNCNSMLLAILFYFLYAQHVSDINISIIRSLRLFCWITTLVVLFLVRCVLEIRCGWFGVVSVLQAEACNTDILMSETRWAHKKLNKIVSDIMLVFYSSTITMMHCPINIRLTVIHLVLPGFWSLPNFQDPEWIT